MTSLADLRQELGVASDATVFRHLKRGKRGPQRETVVQYAHVLHVHEAYFLTISNHVDDVMIEDAKRIFESAYAALLPHLHADRADDLWKRISTQPLWGNIAAGAYMGVQRDRAERDCGLRQWVRPEVIMLIDVLKSLRVPLQQYVVTPKPTDLVVDLIVRLPQVVPAGLVEQIRAAVRDLYERLGVNLTDFDRELERINATPTAWLRSH